jgi:hypothetical protein
MLFATTKANEISGSIWSNSLTIKNVNEIWVQTSMKEKALQVESKFR